MDSRFRLGKSVVILIVFLLAAAFFLRPRDYSQETLSLDKSVSDIIGRAGLRETDLLHEKQKIHKSGRHLFLKIEKHYEAGTEFDADSFLMTIREFLKDSKFDFAEAIFEKRGQNENISISLSFKNRILYEMKFRKKDYQPYVSNKEKKDARIAIVLDDCGYNMNNIGTLRGIGPPLTISILPNLPYSERVAKEARNHNFEVILHLPLEPHNGNLNLEKGTLMVDMSTEEVNNLLVKAIDSVPGLRGVSNHMGSRATEDRDFMRGLFEELKKRDLYFLDNLVTDNSVCREVAKSAGLRIVVRSVFLDNEADEDYIERQIFHTAQLAEKTGWAIGIGHDRPYTIKVLSRLIPQLKRAGFEFVYVSELVQ
jgi:polysaccharide deacetylase 2 family uncharacterized protein YibQ